MMMPVIKDKVEPLILVRQRFFWSGMDTDIKKYVSHCKRCVVGKTPEPEARAPLESIKTSVCLWNLYV